MNTHRSPHLDKFLLWSVLSFFAVCLLLIGLWFIGKGSTIIEGQRIFTLFDDAMISMTYARNLAEGHGLVWNIGEPPVEGYTNPLWTVWLAILHLSRLPDTQMGFLVSLSGLLILVANVYIFGLLTCRVSSNSRLATFTSVSLTTFCFPLIFWTLRGMEVGLLALLINLIFLTTFDLSESNSQVSKKWLGILIAATVFTRMESILIVVPLIYYGFSETRMTLKKQIWTSCIVGGIGALIILSFFRKFYYGEWLPNTYYLKLTGVTWWVRCNRGLQSIYSTFRTSLGIPLILVFIAFIIFKKNTSNLNCLLLFGVFQFLYSIHVGGDAWEWSGIANRYISVALPILFVLFGRSVGMLENWATNKKNLIV